MRSRLQSPSMTRVTSLLALVLLAACTIAQPTPAPAPPQPAPPQPAPSSPAPPVQANPIDAKTAKLQLIDGFLPLYWDEENGKLLMRITRLGEELIYATSLPGGLGSNPMGLDRAG